MDLAYFFGRAWDFILWFANLVVGTVASSIFGGWTAVLALAVIALVLFLLTRSFLRRRSDD
jgi:membrane protein implicated in regulation of membrane protease activity